MADVELYHLYWRLYRAKKMMKKVDLPEMFNCQNNIDNPNANISSNSTIRNDLSSDLNECNLKKPKSGILKTLKKKITSTFENFHIGSSYSSLDIVKCRSFERLYNSYGVPPAESNSNSEDSSNDGFSSIRCKSKKNKRSILPTEDIAHNPDSSTCVLNNSNITNNITVLDNYSQTVMPPALSHSPVHPNNSSENNSVIIIENNQNHPTNIYSDFNLSNGLFGDGYKSSRHTWASELKDLAKCGWYWGPISRREAENKLYNQVNGAFLVRDSTDDRYLLSLSFRSNGTTLHTRIEHSNGKFYYILKYILKSYSIYLRR